MRAIIIEARRSCYSKEEVNGMTVKELIQYLEEFDEDAMVVLSHDNGYTYGGINERDIREDEDDEMEWPEMDENENN